MKVRFRARGTALVMNIAAMEARIKRFIGRKYTKVSDDPEQWGFVPTGEDDEVEYHGEYLKACKDGDLWPADKATADFCGVPFDPTFGGSVKPAAKSEKPSA